VKTAIPERVDAKYKRSAAELQPNKLTTEATEITEAEHQGRFSPWVLPPLW